MDLKKIIKKVNQLLTNTLAFIQNVKEVSCGFLFKLKNILKKSISFLYKIFKEIWNNIKKPFYNTLGILVAIFCISIIVFFTFKLILHINPPFIDSLQSKYIFTPNIDPKGVENELKHLISLDKIISASDVYNNMLHYYNTLITILIALLGVFGFISWISIQAKIKHEAEMSVENKFENKDFQCRLQDEIEMVSTQIFSENSYMTKLVEENINAIVSKLLCSQQFIDKMKEIVQNSKDDKNIVLEPLNGIENGDEI